MPIRIENFGFNNSIEIHDTLNASMNGTIHIEGNDNRIKLHEGITSEEFYFHIGTRVDLAIEPNCRIAKLSIYTSQDNKILIGANAAFVYQTKLHLHEPSSITIGKDSLFADNIYITTSDMHSIIDAKTGERINYSKDVTIGEHVWLGMQVTVLKGSSIGAGSIIGACSLVAGNIPEFSLAAGHPARVIRQGVTWRPDLIYERRQPHLTAGGG